jgi:hypothetical protein
MQVSTALTFLSCWPRVQLHHQGLFFRTASSAEISASDFQFQFLVDAASFVVASSIPECFSGVQLHTVQNTDHTMAFEFWKKKGKWVQK